MGNTQKSAAGNAALANEKGETFLAPYGWIPQGPALAPMHAPNLAPAYVMPFPQQLPGMYLPAPSSSFFDSYLFFSVIVTLLILVILWRKNPLFIQNPGLDPMIQESPSITKLVIIGMVLLAVFLLAPTIANWKIFPL